MEKFGKDYYEGSTSNYKGYTWDEVKPAVTVQMKILESRGLAARGLRVLDVGCAKGFFLKMCDSKGMETHGIEVSSYAAKEAVKNSRGRITNQSAEERYPYEDGLFDVITCFDTIEHLPNPEKAIAEMHRVLKSGGRLVMTTDNKNSMRRFFGVFISKFKDGDATHINVRTIGRWKRNMRDAGFTVEDCETRNFIGLQTLKLKTRVNLEPLFPFGRDWVIMIARKP